MSHVDDGTLHAYLDGELTPVERERTDAHLAGCEACRARLAEERTMIERAGQLLGLAAPPERTAPPLHLLRRPTGRRGFMIPLAWAATVALALGIGWYTRGTWRSDRAPEPTVAETRTRTAPASAPAAEPPTGMADNRIAVAPVGRERDEERRNAATPPASPAPRAVATTTDQVARQERDQPPPAAPVTAAKTLRLRGAVASSEVATNIVTDGSIVRLSASWPGIEPSQARDLLGEEPGVIPGYAVRALRRDPADPSQIVVEQSLDSGVVLLFERRSDTGAGGARRLAPTAQGRKDTALQAQGFASNERLARYVRSLRVEIVGALSADSLSILLSLVR